HDHLQRRGLWRHGNRRRFTQLVEEILRLLLVAVEDEPCAAGHAMIAAAIDDEEVSLAETAAAIGAHEDAAVAGTLGNATLGYRRRHLRQNQRLEIVAHVDRVAGVGYRRERHRVV